MDNKLDIFNATQIRKNFPDFRPGDTIKVFQKINEGDKERTQMFEGILIAKKHGRGPNATITVRKISFGVGVERVYPLHSPLIEKIEIVSRGKARRAKLYYLRERTGRSHSLKTKKSGEKEVSEPVSEESQGTDAEQKAEGEMKPAEITKE